MGIGHTGASIRVEVAAGTAFALLAALAAMSRSRTDVPDPLAGALADVGDPEGETWLNLLGVALDVGPPYDAHRLLDALSTLDAVEVRRHLLGRYAWSWCTLAGTEDIEAAAAGDDAAAARLLAHPRYYAGHAATSLGTLLSLDPDETRRRLVRAVETGSQSLLDPATTHRLEEAREEAEALVSAHEPLLAIERVVTGYRYVPEPEAERVVLVPHAQDELQLVLAQHRSSRLVVYQAGRDRVTQERVLALGRALADPKRVEILALVGRGIGQASELIRESGLSRSTVHHHLALLREVGLIELEGNARAYTYFPRAAAAADAAALVADLTRTKEAT
jgi:DNA-binding transcriptional ArsR family regulator